MKKLIQNDWEFLKIVLFSCLLLRRREAKAERVMQSGHWRIG
jgi:hypothetical protein